MMNDLTNQKFGRLTAAWPVGRNKYGNVCWMTFCECGKSSIVQGRLLRNGDTKSCGCLYKETCSRVNLKHGHARHSCGSTPEYHAYQDAKSRCTNPKDKDYANYGGRGIQMKFASFEEFLFEVGPKPEPKSLYSIDRINNNGHYEAGNVKWSTQLEQIHNRRCCRKQSIAA